MKNIRMDLFPGGKSLALTFSYDDGRIYDRDLVKIFNQYGVRGTFHLNSSRLGIKGYIEKDEVRELYQNHEISAHTLTHPHLEQCPDQTVVREILEDRRNLEQLAGYPVRGMSYPYGTYNDSIVQIIQSLGIEYARTIQQTERFGLPADFLKWPATCKHTNPKLMDLGSQFLDESRKQMKLMYVWGHSYEFNDDGNWYVIEEFCKLVGGRDNVWYATNIEIVDYIRALRSLKVSVDGSMIMNPSAMPVWISIDGNPVRIDGGQTVRMD